MGLLKGWVSTTRIIVSSGYTFGYPKAAKCPDRNQSVGLSVNIWLFRAYRIPG